MNVPATSRAQQLREISSAATTTTNDAVMPTSTPLTTPGGSGIHRRPSVGAGAEDPRSGIGSSGSSGSAAAAVVTAKKRSAPTENDDDGEVVTPPHHGGNHKKKAAPERSVLGQRGSTEAVTADDGAEPLLRGDDDEDGGIEDDTALNVEEDTTAAPTMSRAALEAIRDEHEALRKLAKKCFQAHTVTRDECDVLTERLQEALDEAGRYRSMEEHNRKTIANLIRAKECAMTQARAAALAASQEGPLRAQLKRLTEQYEKAVADHAESSRTCSLLKGDLEHAHVQLSKARSDKAKIERELRKAHHALQVAQSNATSSHAHNELAAESDKSELEFYKGKSSSLSVQLNRMGAVVAEKDRQIDEMRRQLERYQMMNHHKLHESSAASGNGGGAGGGGIPKSKSH